MLQHINIQIKCCNIYTSQRVYWCVNNVFLPASFLACEFVQNICPAKFKNSFIILNLHPKLRKFATFSGTLHKRRRKHIQLWSHIFDQKRQSQAPILTASVSFLPDVPWHFLFLAWYTVLKFKTKGAPAELLEIRLERRL